MDAIRIRNIIYLPAPFLGIFLERNQIPEEAWSRMQGDIVAAGATVDFRPIIDWLRVALMRKSGEDQPYPLFMSQPTTLLVDDDLMLQHHKILTCHLCGIDPLLQRVQGSRIATHIGGVVVKM